LNRRLAQRRVFDDVALYAIAIVFQSVAQLLQITNQPVDLARSHK